MTKLLDVLVSKGSPIGLDYKAKQDAKAKAKAVAKAKYQRDVAIQALLKARRQHKASIDARECVFACVKTLRDLG